MDPSTYKDPQLSLPDQWVVDRLLSRQVAQQKPVIESHEKSDSGYASEESERPATLSDDEGNAVPETQARLRRTDAQSVQEIDHDAGSGAEKTQHDSDVPTILRMKAHNDGQSSTFEPTVFVMWDLHDLKARLPALLYDYVLTPYVRFAQSVARHPTDAVFTTHLLLYFTTSVPSAIYLFNHFTYVHGVLHLVYQLWLIGTYTLMMHQHIHQRGILNSRLSLFDQAFPYILDPLHGHTWNTYYFHHVKHHHVEGNGPGDLSSTIRYQRDNPWHLAHYVAHFILTTWFDLFRYFARKGQHGTALKALASELGGLGFVAATVYLNPKPATFVFLLPLCLMRIGLMLGNWGQHALVDEIEPDSDFRSSITLIDVPSNRFCFNDGYHTSHHLNPRRHWRDHPMAFLNTLKKYEDEYALVFRNIDYLMMTVRLMRKDYAYLARCMIPIGDQVNMSMREREEMLRRKTRAFSEEEIKAKFGKDA